MTEFAHRIPPGGPWLPPDQPWLLAEADRLLTGARAARHERGGFGWLDDDGALAESFGRPLWITARMTHCFALGALLGRAADAQWAGHGVRALAEDYRDDRFGGWFAHLGQQAPEPGPKGAYEHAFVILAASSATVAGLPGARTVLDDALQVQHDHFWDDDAGAVVEGWDRSWSVSEPYRGANANMHTVEAYLAATDATGERVWRDRALRIATRIVDGGARAHGWRLPEHFDAHWNELPDYHAAEPAHAFRPFGVTPGHALEWARLLLHLEAGIAADGLAPPPWLRPAAVDLFDRAIADGWDAEHGGLCYTTDWNGKPVVRQHFHWVVCEAIAAAWALHQATGEQRFGQWYARLWAYARQVFITPGGYGWCHEVNPDGSPSTVTWRGRPDIYHALQAVVMSVLPVMSVMPLAPGLAASLARRRVG